MKNLGQTAEPYAWFRFCLYFLVLSLEFQRVGGTASPSSSVLKDSIVPGSARSKEQGRLIEKYRLVSPATECAGEDRVSQTYDYEVSFYNGYDGTTTSYKGTVVSSATAEEICGASINAWRSEEIEFTTVIRQKDDTECLVYYYRVMSRCLNCVSLQMKCTESRPEPEDASGSDDVFAGPGATF